MPVRGVLLDLEGVLYEGDSLIEGATGVVKHLVSKGFSIRYLTNTTVRPKRAIAARMEAMGFDADPTKIFSPAMAARRLLDGQAASRIHVAAAATLTEDFEGFELVQDNADAIVVGDLYKGFDWDRLNRLFQMIRGGARLVALHKNRYCRREEGLSLDLGPFVAALEYAAGVTADVVGKPSADFFTLALDDLNLSAEDAVMVGDDLDADIAGAQSCGIRAVQVETGKFSTMDLERTDIIPDARIRTIAELPVLLERMD